MSAFYSLRRLRSWWVALLPLLAGCAPSKTWQGVIGQSTISERVRHNGVISIAGYALDSASGAPIPNMPLDGIMTDRNGFFRLKANSEFAFKQGSTVRVRTLLYEGRFTVPADTTHRVTVKLRRNSFRFRPYGCQISADSVYMTPYALPWLMMPSEQLAFLIQGNASRKPTRVRTITLRIGENGFPREPFRIRFYKNNGPEQPPGAEFVTEYIGGSAAHNGLFSIDISSYSILLPEEGFFIAVDAAMDSHFTANLMEAYTPTGPVLRAPCAFADTRTWLHAWYNEGWHRATSAESCWPLYENALSVEVEPAH